MKNILPLIFIGSTLTACSSIESFKDNEIEISNKGTPIYLRGNFNTWEAQPEYQLKKINSDVLQTKIKLSTAGQTYEFKIADENWSQGLNCGYLNEDLD